MIDVNKINYDNYFVGKNLDFLVRSKMRSESFITPLKNTPLYYDDQVSSKMALLGKRGYYDPDLIYGKNGGNRGESGERGEFRYGNQYENSGGLGESQGNYVGDKGGYYGNGNDDGNNRGVGSSDNERYDTKYYGHDKNEMWNMEKMYDNNSGNDMESYNGVNKVNIPQDKYAPNSTNNYNDSQISTGHSFSLPPTKQEIKQQIYNEHYRRKMQEKEEYDRINNDYRVNYHYVDNIKDLGVL